MLLSGVNKLCAQCTEKCKQWEQVKVIRSPSFKNKQGQKGEFKIGYTLQA